MGYTHYWRRYNFDRNRWPAALFDCGRLIGASPVPLQLERRTYQGHECVFINGTDGQDCEPMVLPMDADGVLGFQFCKTRQWPYDLVVTACLCVLAETGIRVSSDGTPEDWEPGAEWASKVLGRTVEVPQFGH